MLNTQLSEMARNSVIVGAKCMQECDNSSHAQSECGYLAKNSAISWSALEAYKHPLLVSRLSNKLHLSHYDAEVLFHDTKIFLYLCAKHPGQLAPTAAIDEGWHNFILFTKDYQQFCTDYLGRFIHHDPIDPAKPICGESVIIKSIKLAQASFTAITLSKNWTA